MSKIISSNAFLLEMCMGCLKSDCELNERKTNANADYIHLVNACFPELEVHNISYPIFC